MKDMKETLLKIFQRLNEKLEYEVKELDHKIVRSKITVLGQASLMAQPELTYMLSLAQTGDLDALIGAQFEVRKNLKEILREYGFVYDDDSEHIFIPAGSSFTKFAEFSLVEVELIDPESALVSKAVKAPEKNIQLIRQAIASGEYPTLAGRIVANGGDLKNFI